MSDSGQPQTRKAPWAPLAIDPDSRASVAGAIESGAILRSPAQPFGTQTDQAAPSWPWEDPESHRSETPIAAGPSVATERLYRSEVSGVDDAESVDRPVDAYAPESDDGLSDGGTAPQLAVDPAVDPFLLAARTKSTAGDDSGMRTWGVVLVDVLATSAAAVTDFYLNRELTWITGATFVLACLITAITVRSADLSVAVITPPLAFVAAVAVAGAAEAIDGSGSLLLREGRIIITALAFNAPYVFAGTGLALVIVAVRALRARA